MLNIIRIVEKLQNKENKKICFRVGDTLEVKTWVIESNKKRLQTFEGIVISIKNCGLNSVFTMRKISHGEGVERVFQINSPIIESVYLKRCGMVRRAKLYYLRKLSGKSARIKERMKFK